MLKKFKYKEVTWIDLESPTKEELAAVGQEYDLHPVALGELQNPTTRVKVDVYNNLIYAVFHFPRGLLGQTVPAASAQDYVEIDFILGKNLIISTHYELVNALNDFSKIFESDSVLKRDNDKIHAGFVFYYIIKEIYRALELGLSDLNDRLRSVERQIFGGQEREVVKILADINHELLDCRWALKHHHQLFSSLELVGPELFGEDFKHHLSALTNDHRRIWNMVRGNRAALIDLQDTNDSLLSIKNNEVVKILTVIATIFLPLNLIAQIFSAAQFPSAISPTTDFLMMLGLMLIAVAAAGWIIKKRQWL